MRYGLILAFVLVAGCDETSDSIQQQQQEKLLAEGTAQIGMPNIKNFRERKILKDIYELRDQDGFVTYTYTFSEVTGKFTFVGQSLGYGIPASTQFTSPQKAEWKSHNGYVILPQADPNGLFSPASSEATWIMLKDPNSNDVKVCYMEQRINVFPFKLPDSVVNH